MNKSYHSERGRFIEIGFKIDLDTDTDLDCDPDPLLYQTGTAWIFYSIVIDRTDSSSPETILTLKRPQDGQLAW